jgi:hypothetical protein
MRILESKTARALLAAAGGAAALIALGQLYSLVGGS